MIVVTAIDEVVFWLCVTHNGTAEFGATGGTIPLKMNTALCGRQLRKPTKSSHFWEIRSSLSVKNKEIE